MLLSDITRAHDNSFELAAFPVTSKAARMQAFEDAAVPDAKNRRGQFETMFRIGELEACSAIRFVVCDGQGSHEMLKRKMLELRLRTGSPASLENIVPFFKDLISGDSERNHLLVSKTSTLAKKHGRTDEKQPPWLLFWRSLYRLQRMLVAKHFWGDDFLTLFLQG